MIPLLGFEAITSQDGTHIRLRTQTDRGLVPLVTQLITMNQASWQSRSSSPPCIMAFEAPAYHEPRTYDDKGKYSGKVRVLAVPLNIDMDRFLLWQQPRILPHAPFHAIITPAATENRQSVYQLVSTLQHWYAQSCRN